MLPVINFIGAGRLGKSIAKLITKQKIAHIQGVTNSNHNSSCEAVQFIGSGAAFALGNLPAADITFISTPDDDIQTCCQQLARSPFLKPNSIVAHCSGSLSSKVLVAAQQKGCHTASIHPMRSFAQPLSTIEQFHGTYCAIEGDEQATQPLDQLFQQLSAIIYPINKQKKGAYHAGGVMASNYLLTLSESALTCLAKAGVERDIAIRVIINLMRDTLNNLENSLSPQQSLTGPIQRADLSVLRENIEGIAKTGVLNIYQQLGIETIKLTTLTPAQKEAIRSILEEELTA